MFHGQEDGDSILLEHPLVVSDGTWHKVEFNIVRTIASLLVENQTISDVLPQLIRTGKIKVRVNVQKSGS